MKFDTVECIEPKVIQRHRGDTFYRVTILKDSNGRIGGYMLQPAILDDPISYLDCHGNHLTSFHIFGSNDEKEKAMQIITPLMEQFPLHEPLDCGK